MGDLILVEFDDPITVVGRKKLGDIFIDSHHDNLNSIIQALGLGSEEDKIALAMFGYHGSNPQLIVLRHRLLEVCGLSPD